MIIKELNIINFKNIAEATLAFSPGFNCFVGNNGVGKTNVLDALYHLSMCKSYFNLPDLQNIRHGEPFLSCRENTSGKVKNWMFIAE